MTVSVVLLTWNSERFVAECITSIRRGFRSGDAEIIVVDNGSRDCTLGILSRNFPELQVIKNLRNRGVARARNQGIYEAKGEFVILLDIDTVVSEGSIDQLITVMINNPDVGICGPKLLFPDGSLQDSCRKFPLVQTKILRRVKGRGDDGKLTEESYDITSDHNGLLDVDYVIGACQVIRRSALDRVGCLDERIFYGPEDVDLCIRMHLKGWRVVYVPAATVVHYLQRVTKSRLLSALTWKHTAALLYFFLKHKYLCSRKRLYKRISMTA